MQLRLIICVLCAGIVLLSGAMMLQQREIDELKREVAIRLTIGARPNVPGDNLGNLPSADFNKGARWVRREP
jgi:hypothetical protein